MSKTDAEKAKERKELALVKKHDEEVLDRKIKKEFHGTITVLLRL